MPSGWFHTHKPVLGFGKCERLGEHTPTSWYLTFDLQTWLLHMVSSSSSKASLIVTRSGDQPGRWATGGKRGNAWRKLQSRGPRLTEAGEEKHQNGRPLVCTVRSQYGLCWRKSACCCQQKMQSQCWWVLNWFWKITSCLSFLWQVRQVKSVEALGSWVGVAVMALGCLRGHKVRRETLELWDWIGERCSKPKTPCLSSGQKCVL